MPSLDDFSVAGIYQLFDKRGREEVRLIDLLYTNVVRLATSFLDCYTVRSERELMSALLVQGFPVMQGGLAGLWDEQRQALDAVKFCRRWVHWDARRKHQLVRGVEKSRSASTRKSRQAKASMLTASAPSAPGISPKASPKSSTGRSPKLSTVRVMTSSEEAEKGTHAGPLSCSTGTVSVSPLGS